MLRGMLDGPYIVYSRDGRMMSAASYREDKLEGGVVDYDVYVQGSGGELQKVKRYIRIFSGGREVLSPK
jgi:antitoxin component YwqK of YwqJK toxin-antitoxin module